MIAQQYVSDFNKSLKKSKNLSHTDQIAIKNKLKVISNNISDLATDDLDDFFTNLYSMLSDLNTSLDMTESILDVLNAVVQNKEIQSAVTADYRFLPALITKLFELPENNNEQRLVKLLMAIKEMLKHKSELSEHHLKRLIGALADFVENHSNQTLCELSLEILVNLCLKNPLSECLITRKIKSTQIRAKIKQMFKGLIGLKYFFAISSDEVNIKDVLYFFTMSLSSIATDRASFDLDAINHSLDVLEFIQRKELHLDLKIAEDEKINHKLEKLIASLISALSETEGIEKKQNFFDGISKFFKQLLLHDLTLVSFLKDFTKELFLSDVSESEEALRYLSIYLQCDGVLESTEVIVEKIVENFFENEKKSYEQKFAFLCLLQPLHSKNMISETHIPKISQLFEHLMDHFKNFTLQNFQNEKEVFLFVYFAFALSVMAKIDVTFYRKLNDVVKLSVFPYVIAKGNLSKRTEVIEVLYKITAIDNFPSKKIAEILSGSNLGQVSVPNQVSNSAFNQNTNFTAEHICEEINEEIDQLVQRIQNKLDSEDINSVSSADLIQLYRTKIDLLNDQLTSVTDGLDSVTVKNAELMQRIAKFRRTTEKQELTQWCLQLDKERLILEAKHEADTVIMLTDSVAKFQAKLMKEGKMLHEKENLLREKTKEIEEIIKEKVEFEKKFKEIKDKWQVMNKENESRLNQLKESNEADKKKLVAADKENQTLKELIKIHEKELMENQTKMKVLDEALKEAEQMKATILSVMTSQNKSNFKNK